MTVRKSILLLLLGFALAGCLKRKETITLHRSGSLTIRHKISGDGDDLDSGAARYPGREAWDVKRSVEVNAQGDKEHVLTATARFARAGDVPTRFGPRNDPLAAQAMRFTTEVTIRKENGRTYYRFVRTYLPRTWAPYRVFKRRAIPEDVEKLMEDAEPAHLPAADRRRILEAFVEYERLKLTYWSEEALAKTAQDHVALIDAQLAVRAAIRDYCKEELNFEKLDGVLLKSDDEIDDIGAEVYDDVARLAVGVARLRLELDNATVTRLRAAWEALKHDFDVSDDLEDEAFEVELTMPGRLIADNGDGRDGGAVLWRFHARDFRDRKHVLIATSIVDAE